MLAPPPPPAIYRKNGFGLRGGDMKTNIYLSPKRRDSYIPRSYLLHISPVPMLDAFGDAILICLANVERRKYKSNRLNVKTSIISAITIKAAFQLKTDSIHRVEKFNWLLNKSHDAFDKDTGVGIYEDLCAWSNYRGQVIISHYAFECN